MVFGRGLTDEHTIRQDEIRELEDQLIRLDDEDKDENPLWLKSRKLDDAREGGDRRALIREIDDKLKEYGTEVPAPPCPVSLSAYKFSQTNC